MKVGDLRVFSEHAFYANKLFIVIHVDDLSSAIQIKIVSNGETHTWDRIVLLYDSKSVAVKKCP